MLEQRQMLTAALTGLEATALTYMEHSTPPSTNPTIPLSSAITATDSTATVTTATSATIRISAGYQSGEDVLSYVGGPATITASPFSNGTIVLTSVAPGGATLGDFTAALQSLYYHDSAATPSQVARTVTFAFTDPSGPSPAVTRNITFVNDNPVLTGLETTPLTYLQHSNPPNLVANNDTPISSAITVTESDPSVTTVTGAIIQFTPGTYISTEDNLVFQNTTTIIGSWDAATGKLTLSGTDTLANYTAALQSVAYYNSSKTPNTNSQRVVTYTVSNADGSSTSVSRSILITAVDSNPVVTGTSTLGYVDHALVGYPIIGPTGVAPSGPDSNNATILSPTIAVTSPDPAAEAPDITSATIKFSSGSYKSDQDQLIFNNTPKITGSWNSATGTLTLSGDDTLANYTTALQNVYYQNTMETAAPNTSTRTVSFTVTDSYGYTSASVTQSITLTHKDDAPVLGMGPTEDRVPINYVEPSIPGSTPLTISSTITASDPDTGYLQGVVIQISGGAPNEDQLLFTKTSTIGGTWNFATETLTLSGVDTLLAYSKVLRTIQYSDLFANPTPTPRIVTYAPIDNTTVVGGIGLQQVSTPAGISPSVFLASRTIIMVPIDGPPVLTNLESTPLHYPEHSAPPLNTPLPVTSAIQISDPEIATLESATVQITGNYQLGEDQLIFNNATFPKISGTWNIATGTMTLTGVDTLTNYQAALQAVEYEDLAASPNPINRTLTFQATDDLGTASQTVNRTIVMVPTASIPTLVGLETTPLNYVDHALSSTPTVTNNIVPISGSISVVDPGTAAVQSATIQITGNYQSGEDQLIFTNTSNITGFWDASTGTLKLSGVDTLANYTAALKSVQYTDLSQTPNTAQRTVSYTVTDINNQTNTVVPTRLINVTATDDPPVLTGLETVPLLYLQQTPAAGMPVTSTINVTDPDSANLQGAAISISAGYQSGEDKLLFTNTPKITGVWNGTTGTLLLIGVDTVANYAAALQSVSYIDTSTTPNTAVRTLSFQVTDSAGLSGLPVTRSIDVIPISSPPVLTNLETTPISYTAQSTPKVSATITVNDSLDLESATIVISGGYQAGEDKLLFTNTAKIGATWNATSGTLTLSGVDTVVNYTAALRAVSYTDTAANPNPTVRTLSFTATDDTGLTGAAVTRSIVQVPSASPPVLTGLETTPLNYQDHPFVSPLPATNNVTPVSAAITVTDPSTGNLLGATVQITGNYHGAEDQLVFVNTATITGTWNAATGTLTLTGSDTLANYTAALRSVSYTDISATPNTSLRTVSFVATDADGLSSTAVTRTITVTAVDDPPVLTGVETGPLSYTAHTSPAITGTITVTDSDSVNLESATIQITGNYQATEDKLLFTNTAKIGATWNATSGTLTLTGVDTLANYTAALRAVSYTDTAAVPSTLVRTLTFQVTDDSGLTGAGAAGAAVTRSIIITPVNVPPVLVGLETTPLNYLDHAFVSPTPPLNNITPISAAITATDTDTGNLLGATIQITANYHSAEDQLVFVNTATITGSWNAANGTLTLTGNDTLANYTTALRTVSYTDTSATPNQLTRTVAFTITDANGLSSTAVTRTITVTAVDDPPVLTGLEATPLSYFELASPVGPASVTPVTAAITAADPDSALLESATVQITGNYQAGEDKLVFTNTPKIGAVWNATNGTLTLSGVDTLANYTTALRAVSYTDTAAIPNPLQRTLTFQTTDSSGLPSATVTRGIVMIPVAVPPVLSGIPNTPLNYVDHPLSSTPSLVNNVTPITPAITVGDLDTGNITSATVQITVNYQIGEDVLVYPNVINKISGTFNAATGTLTLTGTDTLANYTLALESISYTNTNIVRPNPLTRTVSFQVTDDRGLSSTIGTRDLVEVHSDDPPVLSSIETTPLFYIEGTTNQPITNTIAIADPDSLNGSGAVIQITGNYLSNQDKLQFTNTPKITGTWIAGSGTLVLTGTDTLANYQAALQAVDYVNTSQNPSVVLRTVTFQILDDKSLASLPVSRTIDVIPVDNPPVLTGLETTTLSYVDHAFPPASPVNNITPISAAITVTDPDSLNLQGATVQITGNYQSNQDQLVFTNTLTITGTWNPTTGTLTLSGIDTLANYTAALQSVSYTDTSLTPSLLTRTVSFKATDDSGVTGAAVTRTITVAHNDDPPALTGLESTSLTYTENISSFATVPLTNTLVASDPDSTNAEKATVQITGGYLNGQDQLLFTNTTKIAGSWNATNGTLTLTGVDTFANYQAALRSITYENLSHNPSSATRTVSFQTTDDQGLLSPIVTRTITVVPVNNPSVLASSLTTLSYGEGTGAKPINPAVTVSDVDSTTLASAVITLTNYVSTEDVLGFVANAGTMGNIAISSNSNGVLTLTSAGATATLAQWQTALRAVTYTNTSGDLAPTPRTATIVVNDGGSANATSNTLTTTINIAVYFPPVLSGSSTLGYVEQNPAMAINKTILVTDASSATLASATITITNFVTGQDVLGFVNDGATMGNIALQSNTGGVLTLTSAGSTATLAQWQAALQAVTYLNSSLNPSAVTRNVTFQVNSGTTVNNLSNIASSTITVTPVNNPPALSDTLDATALSYTENSTAVAVAPNIFVGDPDSTNLMGATIKIIGNDNYQGSQDTLAFTNTAKITGTWSASTGTLTLTGTDTVADYQAALRSITFSNKLDGTSAPSRTVSFTVIDDTHLTSNTFTRTINLTTVDSPPVLTGIETTPKIYNLNDPFNRYGIITSTLTLTDSDSTMMSGATAQITGNYNASQDKLSFNISGTAITGSWNGTTGTLTLTGNDTTANYQAALRTLEYYNFTGTTAGPNRTVSITVMDSSHVASNTVTRVIQLETTNTPPTLAINSTGTLNYTEGTAAVAIAPAATVTDPDSQMLQGATITISGNYQLNQDQLVFVTLGNIKGVFQPTTGSLVLQGADTVSNYQAAIQSVKYIDTSTNPSTVTRTISFTVTDGLATSNVGTRSVTVTPVDNPPLITNSSTALAYKPANGAVVVAPTVTVTDPDSAMLTGATVQVSFNYQRGNDVLSFVNTTNIKGNFNATTGILTLTGTDTVANYRLALQSIKYQFVGTATTMTKMVSFQATDGQLWSNIASQTINVTP